METYLTTASSGQLSKTSPLPLGYHFRRWMGSLFSGRLAFALEHQASLGEALCRHHPPFSICNTVAGWRARLGHSRESGSPDSRRLCHLDSCLPSSDRLALAPREDPNCFIRLKCYLHFTRWKSSSRERWEERGSGGRVQGQTRRILRPSRNYLRQKAQKQIR